MYDNAGRLVGDATSLDNNKTKTMMSLSELESGIYFVKCYKIHLTIISKLLNSKINSKKAESYLK